MNGRCIRGRCSTSRRCCRLAWLCDLFPVLRSAGFLSASLSGAGSSVARPWSSISRAPWRRRSVVFSGASSVRRIVRIDAGAPGPLASWFRLHGLLFFWNNVKFLQGRNLSSEWWKEEKTRCTIDDQVLQTQILNLLTVPTIRICWITKLLSTQEKLGHLWKSEWCSESTSYLEDQGVAAIINIFNAINCPAEKLVCGLMPLTNPFPCSIVNEPFGWSLDPNG